MFPDFESKWQALVDRDPRAAKAFLYCVKSTGIFCRPTCAARLSRKKNVAFYDTLGEAQAAGYRPCKRCKPLLPENEPHYQIIRETCKLLDQSPDAPPHLKVLADHAHLTQWHFHRVFRRFTGITPRMYWEARHLPAHRQRKKVAALKDLIEKIARMDENTTGLNQEKRKLRPRKQLDEEHGGEEDFESPDKVALQRTLDELNNQIPFGESELVSKNLSGGDSSGPFESHSIVGTHLFDTDLTPTEELSGFFNYGKLVPPATQQFQLQHSVQQQQQQHQLPQQQLQQHPAYQSLAPAAQPDLEGLLENLDLPFSFLQDDLFSTSSASNSTYFSPNSDVLGSTKNTPSPPSPSST
jgi:methylphosphotriester-DNA--protein-cysteine methyltransferase